MLIWKKRQCKNKVEKSDSAKNKDNQCQFPVEMSKLLTKGLFKINQTNEEADRKTAKRKFP